MITALDPLHPAHSAILEVLAAKPKLDMQELKIELRNNKIPVSLPNLYRIVSQMIDVQMLVRDKGKLSLNRIWIPSVLAFAENIRDVYGSGVANDTSFILQDGERREFTAESLAGLDPIWFDALIACADMDPSQEWFAYNSHPWHVIGMSDTELRGYTAITGKRIMCTMVYGNDTFLDQYGTKLVKISNFTTIIDVEIPLLKEGYALWVCGEYIIECIFPDALSKRFTYFFDTVKNIKQFEPSLFADIFQMKVRCKLTLRRNAKEADRLRIMLQKSK